MYERDRLYIGGAWVAPVDGGRIDVVNPATEEVIGHAPRASSRRRRPGGGRGTRRVRARALAAHRRPRRAPTRSCAMAEYLTRAGPPAGRAQHRRGRRADHVRVRARAGPGGGVRLLQQLTRTFPWREVRQGALAPALVVREPVGVIGAVVPFNGPIMSAAAKLAPSLASGCPIVFKPASETPLDVFVLAEAAEAAGIPPGVVNIVPGGCRRRRRARRARRRRPRASSPAAPPPGARSPTACAGSFKRLTLELGGKAAAVLLDDAPIEASLASILPMSFFNSGQACIALSRVLAPRDRYDEVVDAAVEATRAMTRRRSARSRRPCSAP